MSRFKLSVRARILSIALIPSITLLAVGVGASTWLAVRAFQLRDDVSQLNISSGLSYEFTTALEEERRLSLLAITGDRSAANDLVDARKRLDTVMTNPVLVQSQRTLEGLAPETKTDPSAEVQKAFAQVRQGIDAGAVSVDQAYQFYATILDRIRTGARGVANSLPDSDAVASATITTELIDALESMARGNALAVAVGDAMTPAQLHEYIRQVGAYHGRITTLTPALSGTERSRMDALVNSDEWKTLSAVENAIVDRGANGDDPLPVSVETWQSAATKVNSALLGLYRDHNAVVISGAVDAAEETATWWLAAGVAALIGALLASLITLRISGRLISRLKRLRAEALSMADEHLPRIMARLRSGEDVDMTTEMQPLDFGRDEIGDVAEAFNRAESAAVSAAVEEARTRGGINALFLNIAHRSQIVVHRQLELLDRAEHDEEDPNRLAVLFEFDHLSTRARRNAENLIILGGEQPGRQWRNPVPLVDLLRSAVSETEDYARVHTGHVAAVSVVGSVVADLIHLIAELVENATSFSPPESRVDIVGGVVGKGVVVEITDQGLGMSREQINQANETLREPPNFSVANLSSDSRMGLLVVGQIAARNGVTIRLSESDYGGVRAIVLIPTSLIVANDAWPAGNGVTETNGGTSNGTSMVTRIPDIPWPAVVENGEPPPRRSFQTAPEPRAVRVDPLPAAPQEHRVLAPGQGVQPTAGRPALPRRHRQSSLAPQLADTPQQTRQSQPSGKHQRSSEQVRDLFSAIESGTRQGRTTRPDQGTNYHDN